MASSRISGITIEIGGDTTKLVSAIKEVDSAIKTTQTNLKDINKALKLDPTNTELLKDKQVQLSDAVAEAKAKLDTEKEALEQLKNTDGFDENSEAAKNLKTQIDLDTVALEDLEKQAKSASSVLGTQMQVVGEKIQAVGDKIKSVGDSISGLGTTLSTSLTLPLVAAGTSAVTTFAEVDKTMTLTNATMGTTAEEAELLEDAMKSAASNSTFAMDDAATATLNFARAGLSAEEAAAALAPAMNLAAGEGGDLEVVSAGLVATINGFGDSFDQTSRYADVFAAACNNSALDVDSLSESLSVAAPIFSSAGYSIEDATLYLGTMANAGIDANTAANSLKTGLARLVSPAKEGSEMMEQLGISVTNADGTMKDAITIQTELHDTFANLSESEQIAAASAIFGKNQMSNWLALINTAPEDVQDLANELEGAGLSVDDFADKLEESGLSLDTMKEEMEKLGVSQEAFDNALNASGGNAELFAELLNEATDGGVSFEDVVGALGGDLETLQGVMDSTNGTTEEMADAMMSGFGGSLEKLSSSINVATYSLGEALAPTISIVADKVQELVDWFNSLDSAQQSNIATYGMIIAAIGPVLVIVGKLISSVGSIVSLVGSAVSGIGTLMTSVGGLSGVLTALASPIGITVAVIAALAAGILYLYNTNEGFRTSMQNLITILQTNFQAAIAAIQPALTALGEALSAFGELLVSTFDGVMQTLAPVFEVIATLVVGLISGIMAAIAPLIDFVTATINTITALVTAFIALLTGDSETFFSSMDAAWNSFVQAILSIVNAFISAVVAFFSTFGVNIQTLFTTIFTNIKTTVQTAITNIKTKITTIFTSIKTWLSTTLTTILTKFKTTFDSMKTAVSDKITSIKETIVDGIQAACDFVAGLPDQFYTWGSDMISNLIDGIKSMIGGLADAAGSIAETIASYVHFSVPDKGPLADADDYMPDFVDLLVGGLKTGMPELENAMNGLAASLQPTITATGSGSGGGTTTNNVNINVYGAEGQDVEELADIIQDRINTEVYIKGAVYA